MQVKFTECNRKTNNGLVNNNATVHCTVSKLSLDLDLDYLRLN